MRSNRLSEVLRLFFDPRVFPLFLIGSLALSVAGNGLYALFVDWLGDAPVDHLVILLSSLLILVVIAYFLSFILRFLQRNEAVITNQPSPKKRRGLIFLLSQPEPLEKAFQHHQPLLSHCWLVCSQDTMDMATKFKEAHAKDDNMILIKTINDPFDWEDSRRTIDEIYKSLPEGLTPKDVITDFSGLTKPASVGAILACLIQGRPLQYVPALYERRGDKLVPVAAGDPIEIVIDYERISS